MVAALVVHMRDRESDRILGQQRSMGLVEMHGEIVERELGWAAFAILDLAQGLSIVEHLSGVDQRSTIADEFARACRISGVFDQVRLIDDDGTEIVRVNSTGSATTVVPIDQLQSKADRYYVERAWPLPRGAIYVSPFDLNVEHGYIETPWKPVVRIATPCFDRSGAKRGLLVLNYLGAELLQRLADASESTPGWSALVDDDGFFLVAPGDRPSWGFLFGLPPTFARAYPEAWQRMAHAERGSFDADGNAFTYRRLTLDSKNSRTDDRIDIDLRTVAVTPHKELYASSRAKLLRMAWVGAIVAALLCVTAWRLAWVDAVGRTHENALEKSESRLRRLSMRLLEVQESERQRLSRDLHDDIGQLATAMTIDLGRARQLRGDDAKDQLIERAQAGSAQLLESVRRVSASLRSSELEDLGFGAALRQHLQEVEARTKLVVNATIDVGDEEVPPATAIHLFRVIQEAIANVLKHASVDTARVELRHSTDGVNLTIADAGVGFDCSEPADGLGLLGMRERAELLGGRFAVHSAPGRGTRIEVFVPVDLPNRQVGQC